MRRKLASAAISAVTITLFCTPRLSAQGTYPTVLSLPGSTSALAMGGAYPLTNASPDILFYNPAFVRNGRGVIVEVERYGGRATFTQFVASSSANLTIGVQVLDMGVVNGIQLGDRSLAAGIESSDRAGQVVGTVGYARTLKGVRLGAAGKWIQDWRDEGSAGTAAFDAGAYASPLDFITVGLAVRNIGDYSGTAPFHLPTRVELDMSTDSHEIGIFDAMATAEAHYVRDGKIGGGIGAELSYYPFSGLTFAARGGVRMGTTSLRVIVPDVSARVIQQGPGTFGAGISYHHFTLDYAFEPFSSAPDGHRVSVTIN